MKKIIVFIIALSLSITNYAQTFTAGNIALMVAADGTNANTTASVYELLSATANQSSPVNFFAINGTSGSNALRFQGSTSGSLYLSNSNDRTLICFSGYNTTTGATNNNTILPRGVGTLSSAYTFNLAATYTGVTGKNQRAATTINNTNFYFGDQSGLYTNSASAVTNITNLLCVKAFGGTAYAASATQIGTFSAPNATTFSVLTGLSTVSVMDFYLVSSGSNGASYDVCYIISSTTATAGTISKYSLVSGTWTANGSYTTTFGGSRIAAQVGGGGAYLYAVGGIGSTVANSLIRLTDAAGYNSAINITAANNITLFSATGNGILKGVAFAPIANCTQPSITSLTSNSPVCIGNTINFTLNATGTAPLVYAWTGPNSFTSTSQNPSITNITAAAIGTYSVTVTNDCGTTSSTTIVNELIVTPSVSISANPGNTICSGTNLIFTASPTNGGTTPSYQWKLNGNNVGTNSVTYSNNALTNADVVSCVLTSNEPCASPTAANSNAITINVTSSVVPLVSIISGPGNTFCVGTNVLFTATPTNGGTTPSYQWKLNGNNVGTNSDSYSNNSINNQDVVSCVMTSSNGCASPTIATSNNLTLTTITTPNQPANFTTSSATVTQGQSGITYTVPTDPNTITYNWTYSGTGATINGSGNSITIDFSYTATSGNLNVTATNSCGTSIASSMSITVNLNSTDFTPGRLVVLQTTGSLSKASSAILLKEFTTNGIAGVTVPLPSSGTTPIQTAGVYGGSEGFLTTSTDGKLLVLGGYGTSSAYADITGTTALAVPRVVGKISPSGAYTQVASSSTFFNLNDIRGAISDGYNFWAGGASIAAVDGIDYFGPGTQVGLGTGAIPPKAYGIRIFNGQIYYSTQKAGPTNSALQLGIFSFGSGLPTSGSASPTQIINTGTIIPQDFSFNSTTDVCYIAVNLNTAAGGIQKWIKTGATWSLAYTLSTGVTNIGAYGLLVDYSGANPVIYATTFELTGNRIIKITDTGAGSAATTLVTAVTGVFYKGITFAPVDTGTPFVNLSISTNSASEAGTTVVTVTASSSVSVAGNQSVDLGVSGTGITSGDYLLSNTTITIPSGMFTGSVTFTVVDDTLGEGAETTVLTISNPSSGILLGSILTQNIVIADNDNFPPTITLDVTSTSNYIDGGISPSPPSPFSLSATIGDPTDAGKNLGFYFTINDPETAVGNLTVVVTSSNQTVVTNANLNLTGISASKNLKITPIAVGFSNITIAVSDGVNTTSYVINYAASDPAPTIIAANTFWHTGMSDGSDAIPLDNNYYISGDDELDVINVYARKASGLPFVSYDYHSYLNLPDPSKPEVDVEAAARGIANANKVYFSGSMSNGKAPFDNKPNRDRLFATTVTGTGASTTFSFSGYVNIRTALLAWGDANGYNFTASAAAGIDSKSQLGFSLEGMVFGPDGTTLYLGLRAPLVPTTFRHNALIAPVLNFEAWFNNGAPVGSPTFGSPIELDMDYRGIRDIVRLSNGTYIIVAGSPIDNGGINNMYKWTGNPTDAPVALVNSVGGTLNMEGIMEVDDSTGQLSLSKLQIISDGGANILYQNNAEAKDFGDLHLRKFRSDIITDLDICAGDTAIATANGNTTFCLGSNVNLSSNTGAAYLWSNGGNSQTIAAATSGNYSVAVRDVYGCVSNSLAITINVIRTDLNNDGVTNIIDFLQLLGAFNSTCSGCREDINQDGLIQNADFLELLGRFNQSCN